MRLVKSRRKRTCKKCKESILFGGLYYPQRHRRSLCFLCGYKFKNLTSEGIIMENFKQECINKGLTIKKLKEELGDLRRLLRAKNKEIKLCIKEKQESEAQLNPVKDSLNKMTAAHGKLLRKLKRNKNGK